MFIHHIRSVKEVATFDPRKEDDEIELLISQKCRSLREKEVS